MKRVVVTAVVTAALVLPLAFGDIIPTIYFNCPWKIICRW